MHIPAELNVFFAVLLRVEFSVAPPANIIAVVDAVSPIGPAEFSTEPSDEAITKNVPAVFFAACLRIAGENEENPEKSNRYHAAHGDTPCRLSLPQYYNPESQRAKKPLAHASLRACLFDRSARG
jgi:hypothetical protein